MSTKALTKPLLTAEDLWKIVADGSRYELSKGELLPMTPIGLRHGQIAVKIARKLSEFVDAGGLGIVGVEIGFKLAFAPDTVRAPDVAFVSRKRFPEGKIQETFADFPPDLAVEVLSPSDTTSAMLRKVAEYFAGHVPLVWVVNPATETVAVYLSTQEVKIVSAGEDLDGGAVLPGFRMQVAEVFAQ